jgi:hypothetical protein
MAYIGAGISRFNTADELTVTGTSEFGGNVSFGDNNITNVGSLQIDSIAGDADTNTNITFAGSDVITMTTAGSEAIRIDSSQRVSIGTTTAHTADSLLTLQNSGGSAELNITSGTSGGSVLNMGDTGDFNIGRIKYDQSTDSMQFNANNAERMRVDSSGNLLVGKTAESGNTAGHFLSSTGYQRSTRNGSIQIFNRITTDGPIIDFQRDGSAVGSIGSKVGDLTIGTDDTGFRFYDAGNAVLPYNPSTQASPANTVDLGDSGSSFKDLYLSGQTRTTGHYLTGDAFVWNTENNNIRFATNNTERLRIDSSGRVMIGNTTEGVGGADELTVGNTSAGNGITIRSGTSNSGALFFSDGTSGAAEYDGGFEYSHGSQFLRIISAGSERVRVNSSGNIGIGTGTITDTSNYRNIHVEGTTGTIMRFMADGTQVGQIQSDTNEFQLNAITNDPMVFKTNNTEAMRIDSNGRVLINATSSNTGSKLTVAGSNTRTSSGSCADEGIVLMPVANLTTGDYTPWLAFTPRDSSSTPSRARAAIGAVSTSAVAALDMVFATRSAADGTEMTGADEKMRLTSGGNLLVGGTGAVINSDSKLGVHGRIDASTSGTTPLSLNRAGSDGVIIDFLNDGTAGIGNVSVSGSNVAFNTSSDYRLKENVTDMTGAIDRVKALLPKRFNFIRDADKVFDGFLAHEAQTVVPEAVTGTHNEVDSDGNPVMQGIDQSKLVPLLTGALREAITKIETLETENSTQATQIADLITRVTALEAS